MNYTEKLLEVCDLHKVYTKDGVPTKALNGISFNVLNGEYLGIMGASGSGKTTLLNCIATVIKPTSGQILLSGANISSFDGTKLAEYRGNKIGYLFQDFALLDNLTGKENIILPLSIHNIDIVTAEKKLKDIADFLGITDVLSKFPSQMSGGQKQRVAAARSLISDPDIILADEPTGALDTKSARLLMEKLQEINLRRGRTILMVTHAQDETVTLLNQIAADAQANNEASLSINERPFYLVPSVPMKGLTADENIKIITALIVSDEIYSEFVNSDTCMVYWNFCIPNELVETKGLMLPIMEARDLLKPSGLYYESYLNNFGRQLFYVISGSYTTLYMGFMFLIIACALLALQFLTQMQTTKSRYLTLSILGARREQIKRSINQQVLWYFLLPLILACISGAVGIYAMQLYLYSGAAHLEQSYPLLIAMTVIVVLVMVIYGVAVARTANREIGKLNYKPNS